MAEVDRADVVLHAGDVVERSVLDALATRAVVHAVRGNNDLDLADLPDDLRLELGGVRVATVHDSGARAGRARRMRRRYPDADLVVFGHSHEPVDAIGEDGQRLFNPGSPTQRRRQPHPTMGVLVLERGEVVDHRILRVDAR
jgi:putative phosphoesterase